MQASRYLVSNRTTIIANEAGQLTEYKNVYQRNLSVYKGIDNVLEFRLKNPDQKPIDTSGITPVFVAFDENKQQIIKHDGEVLDDGSTQTRGLFKVTINENDLLNVKEQFLSYSIYYVDSQGQKILTYANEWYDAVGTIQVKGDALPGPVATLSVETFIEDNGAWYSEAIDAQPAINGNEALHTAVVYTNDFSGNLVVQATLDNQIIGQQNVVWTDVASITMFNSTVPVPINFTGVFSYLRFKTTSNPSNKITKILVRN